MDITKIQSIDEAIDFFNEEIAGPYQTTNGTSNIPPIQK